MIPLPLALRRGWNMLRRVFIVVFLGVLCWGIGYRWINPPTTFYMAYESIRLGGVKHDWVDLDDIAPIMKRALVAGEDANFCTHWGVDATAIRTALSQGASRGGSTITQQTVKNVFLWQGRSWLRKGLELGMTPFAEIIWGKRRILELYLNMVEYDTGVFGIQAAAQHHFGVDARNLTPTQAARLVAVLPSPKRYSAVAPTPYLRKRATAALNGAATLQADGRSSCFEG